MGVTIEEKRERIEELNRKIDVLEDAVLEAKEEDDFLKEYLLNNCIGAIISFLYDLETNVKKNNEVGNDIRAEISKY